MKSKKLLLLSSYGGYGHIAAANTLDGLLGDEYEIEVVYPIKELRFFGIPSGESFYNFLISNNMIRLNNWITRHVGKYIFSPHEEKTCRMIQRHIEEKKPDILISLIPFIDYPATEAARKAGIPCLFVTTDYDLHNWVFALEKCTLSNLRVVIGADLPTTRGSLLEKGIPEEAIETIGLPLRPGFLNVKPKEELRELYNIPDGKPVVLIMMGGTGARSISAYTKTLLESDLNIHLVVCTGKKTGLADQLKKIEPKNGNSVDILPFVEDIGSLFALADLLITKPGPGTINEAFSMKLPILIDGTGVPIFWEVANRDLVLQYKVGECIWSLDETVNLTKKYLFDEQTQEKVSRAYEEVPVNTFRERIKPLIEEMCDEALSGDVVMTSRNFDPNHL